MHLRIDRPLVALDLETTGTNPLVDRIIEFAGFRVFPDGRRESLVLRVNPDRTIPPGSTAIHGITDEDVASAPKFADVAYKILPFVSNADLAGFGIIRFDVPLLAQEFRRVGVQFNTTNVRLVDSQRIFHMKEPRNLAAAMQFYCGLPHEDAHTAEADALAALSVLEAQLDRYPDLPHTVPELDEVCNPRDPDAVDPDGKIRWQEGEAVLAFGQKAGLSLRELAEREPSYLRWILNKDFSPEVKALVDDALRGKFPQR